MENPLAHLIPQTANSAAIQVNNSVSDNPLAHLIPSAQSQMPESSFGEKALVGLGHGMLRAGQGVKQLGLLAGEKLGLVPEGRASEYTREVDQDEQLYNKTPVGQSTTGAISSAVGGALPYMVASPAGVVANIAAGSAMGLGSFVPEGGSRALNIAVGGLTGGLGSAALASGAKVYNAIKRNYTNPAAKEVEDLGNKYGVRVFAQNATDSPAIGGVARTLEDVPVLGTKGQIKAQLNEATDAAANLSSKYENEMLGMNFGGKTGMQRLQQVAQSSDPKRAKAAQNLLEQIQQSGDDWNKIIETSGNMKLFRSKLIADKKYSDVAKIADQYGGVDTSNIVQRVNNLIKQEDKAVLKNEGLLKTLNDVREGLLSKQPQMASKIVDETGAPIISEQANILPRQLKYSELKQFRSDLSDKISDYFTGGNAAIGKKGIGALEELKREIDKSLNRFAQSNGTGLKTAWRNADNFYQNAVAPYKDVQLAKALTNASPDEIYAKFITTGTREGGKGTSRAQRFYNALDNKGKAAVRYGMVSEAFEKAFNADMQKFSPAQFASSLDRVTAGKNVFFKGAEKSEIDGFKNLMRHVERAPVALNKPDTGVRWIPTAIAAGGAGGAFVAPAPTAIAAATMYGAKLLLTTNAGRRLLLASSKIKVGTPAMQRVVEQVQNLVQRSAVSANTNEQARELNQGE